MFSCNEKTKKEYVYLSIYMRQTDLRSGLLKGEWEQGSWYTGPSPLGDSPAVILCLDEPFTSRHFPCLHLRSLLRSSPPPPTFLILWWSWTLILIPCQNNASINKRLWRKESLFGLYWETAVFVVLCPLSMHSPPSWCPHVCQSQRKKN